MDPRNYDQGAIESPPDAPSNPSNGYPTDGNPQSGQSATLPGAHWFYKVGESLRNVITGAGLTPADDDLNLFQKAILKLVSQSNHVVRLEDVTFGPSVSDGDAVYWDNANSRYDRAIADGTDKQQMVGFADVTDSIVEAFGRSELFSGLTAGSKYYLSDSTAGAITTTAPSEKVVVGLAKSASVMFVDIDPVAGTPIQDQPTWNTGTDTTESIISPEKLDTKIKTLAIGEGQSWQDLTASRSLGVTYTNTTGRAIYISANNGQANATINSSLIIDGETVVSNDIGGGDFTKDIPVQALIPNGSTYSINSNRNLYKWWELR